MRTFTCAMCKHTFESDWTEAEAQAEYESAFGAYAETDKSAVCDDCYKKFWEWAENNAPELKGSRQ